MKITVKFKSQLYTYFIKRLGAWKYKHGWLRVPTCPYCGRKEKLGINLSSYRTNCFRCGAHPSPAQLIMDVENLETWSELINLLNNGEYNELRYTDEKVVLPEKKTFSLPEGFTNIRFGTSQLARTMRGYISSRGFDVEVLSKLGVGYCTEGKLFGYLILPFYYGSELRYYNARNVVGAGPRYQNPDKDFTGLGKEFIIYNHDSLAMYKTTYICEGVFNALTMGERAVATMGKHISAYQINELIKAPCERYIILLDPDAKEKAIDLGLKLVHHKKVKVVFLPDGKDVNDLKKSSTLKYIWRTRYQCYQDLIKLKNQL